jgi:hypothetical protein
MTRVWNQLNVGVRHKRFVPIDGRLFDDCVSQTMRNKDRLLNILQKVFVVD